MTRKEWMKEHYPNVVLDNFAGGVLGCPYDYFPLPLIDEPIPKTKRCLYPAEECKLSETCTKCWNQEIQEVTK